MSKRYGKTRPHPAKKTQEKDMGESSSVAGGATVPEAAETGEQRKSMVKAVMSHHKADAHPEGPHDAYLHEEKGLVYHHHHKDADPEHLAVVKSDLGKIEGVTGVGQGPEPLAEDGYAKVFPEEPAREDAGTGRDVPPAQTGEQKQFTPREKRIAELVATGRAYKKALKSLPAPKRKAVEDCVHHKIPKLVDEGYEQTQAEAIAFSMCGEKAFGDDEYEQKDELETETEPANPVEDVTDEARPPSLDLTQQTIELWESFLPRLEPEQRAFVEEEIEEWREWGSGRHPDEDFGGADTDPDERDPDNQAVEQEETEEALAPYKRGEARRRKAKAFFARYRKAASQLGPEHGDIVKEIATHLHEVSRTEGQPLSRKHATASHEHARSMDHLYGAITKNAEGVDVTEGKTPADGEDVTEGAAPPAETETAREDEHEQTQEKGVDLWDGILSMGPSLVARSKRIDDIINSRIMGRR